MAKSYAKDKDEYIASKDPYYAKQQEIKSGAPVSKPVAETVASTSPLAPRTTPANTGYSAITSAGGQVNYTTPNAIDFIENWAPGSTMTGSDGSVWYKDPKTGMTTVTAKDGVTASVNGNKVPIQKLGYTQQDIQSFLDSVSANTPAYQGNQWDPTADTLMRTALAMNYDNWAQGPQYAALAGRYSDLGRQAMQNTLGQVSARTGGLASSYAGSAAQQAYNDYMTKLQDAALQMYQSDRGDAIQNAQLAAGMGDRDYGRWLDTLNQYNADRSFAADLLNRAIGQQNYENEWNYKLGRDTIEDARYDQQWANTLEQQAFENNLTSEKWAYQQAEDERARKEGLAKLMAGLGDFRRYEELGLTPEEIEALQNWFALEQMSGGSGGGGGGSGRGGGGGGGDTPATADGYIWGKIDDIYYSEGADAAKNYAYYHPEEFGFTKQGYAKQMAAEHLSKLAYGEDADLPSNSETWVTTRTSPVKGETEKENTTTAWNDKKYGTDYSAALVRAQNMKASGYSEDSIVNYLYGLSGDQLTDVGLRKILKDVGFEG